MPPMLTQLRWFVADQWQRSFSTHRVRRRWWTAFFQKHSRLGRWTYRAVHERLTPTGRFVLCAAGTTVIAGSFHTFMVGAAAFSAFAAMALVSVVMTMMMRPSQRVTRVAPPRCMAGQTVPVQITLTNTGTRPLLDVGAFEYRLPAALNYQQGPQYIAQLEPGKSQAFELDLETSQRGSYLLPGPAALCMFPFGMMQARRFIPQPHPLIVHPAFAPIGAMHIPTGHKHQAGSMQVTGLAGQSMEFLGTRAYRLGDRVQDLHPRSWARVGYPVVRQFQEEYLTRVAVLVDTYQPRSLQTELFEANVSLAAATVDVLTRQEHAIDQLAVGDHLFTLQAGGSQACREQALDLLATTTPSRSDPFDTIAGLLLGRLHQVSNLVLLLLHWDDRRQAFVRALHEQGVMIKPLLLGRDGMSRPEHGLLQCLEISQVKRGIDSL